MEALLVRELGVNGALPVLTPTFLFPASPALILYPKVVVFFLKAKDARRQAQGLVRRRGIERNARTAELAATVETRLDLDFCLDFCDMTESGNNGTLEIDYKS